MRFPRTGRSLGWLYVATMLPAPLNLAFLPSHFLVPGDAAATAARIAAEPMLYRICTLAGLLNNILFVVLALALFRLFQEVDRGQARLLVLLVVLSAAVGLVTLVFEAGPLIVLNGKEYWSAFSRPQLDALVMGLVALRGTGLGIDSAFWGLWLLPFGILVWKSGFMPKSIGVLLIIGCVGYLIQSFTAVLWPAAVHKVFNATIPLVGPGEIFASLWFIVKGNKVLVPT